MFADGFVSLVTTGRELNSPPATTPPPLCHARGSGRRRREGSVHVLVTGHRGYIGVEMVPRCGRRPRGRRARRRLLRRLRLRAAARRRARAATSTSATSTARRPRGLRRRRPPRRAVERPARRPQPGAHLRHQPPRVGPAGARWPRRRACAASCSRRRAASTAPAATSCSTRTPRSTRSPPTASRRSAPSRTSSTLADDDFSPVYLRNATAYGVVAPAARRHRRQQPRRATPSPPARCCCRATARPWRPLVHVADISRAFLRCLDAPRERRPRPGLQRRPDRRELPHPRRRRDRGRGRARLRGRRSPRAPSADTRELPRRLLQDRDAAARLRAAVDAATRASRSLPGVHLRRAHRDRVELPPLLPAADRAGPAEPAGSSAPDLRRIRPGLTRVSCSRPATAARPRRRSRRARLSLNVSMFRQKPSYGTASSWPLCDQPGERLDHELLAGLHVVEDLAPEDEEPGVDPHGGVADRVRDPVTLPSSSACTMWNVCGSGHAEEAGDLVACRGTTRRT